MSAPVASRARRAARLWLVALVWLIPLGFLLMGYWPFGLFPALLLTLWVLIAGRDGRAG